MAAFEKSRMDPEKLLKRYSEAAKYDLNPEKMMRNFISFVDILLERGLVVQGFLDKAVACK